MASVRAAQVSGAGPTLQVGGDEFVNQFSPFVRQGRVDYAGPPDTLLVTVNYGDSDDTETVELQRTSSPDGGSTRARGAMAASALPSVETPRKKKKTT